MRHHKDIKTVLLDQSVMSGLGNIYVDEVLWQVKLHPETAKLITLVMKIFKKLLRLLIKRWIRELLLVARQLEPMWMLQATRVTCKII
ncbi:hypothetical protein [Companilactobacillus paralimentarius]|uniref:hypothetical protein n=1 Tax=Companilactobacillus paralimentarius TaxID=83526 RepID=UPI0027144C9F|nr:hypothetical protein [Companilactobacillus paralimentarius]